MIGEGIEVLLESELHNLSHVSGIIVRELNRYPICLMKGELGAGKTTLVKSVLAELGSLDSATSPTFSLINEYELNNSGKAYHMDLYRLNSKAEVFDIGFQEYLESGYPCLIEWPELVEELIDPPYMEIIIRSPSENRRQYQLVKHD